MVSREKFFEEAEAAGWPPQLTADFIEQIGGWDEFCEAAPDIYHHGAQGGFSGFIYSSDMDELRQKYALDCLGHLLGTAYNLGLTLYDVGDIIGVFSHSAAADWREAAAGDQVIHYALDSLASLLYEASEQGILGDE